MAHGVKVISIGMFTPGNTAVVWRGPMLHRALQQFLADVFWGELDVLLMDLPPGTGDIAISVAQLVPSAELLVVTTPQLAAREVAERAGSIALQTHQQIVGVVENMSWLELPDGTRMELFGSGGGQAVADSLSQSTGTRVPLLGQIPIDQRVREGGDDGAPVVLSDPDSPAAAGARRRWPTGWRSARPAWSAARWAWPPPADRRRCERQVASGSNGAGSPRAERGAVRAACRTAPACVSVASRRAGARQSRVVAQVLARIERARVELRSRVASSPRIAR